MACDPAGNLYTELLTPESKDLPELYQIAKIDSDGLAHAIAGSSRGHKDGPAKDALFWRITALACGPKGDIYVADGTPKTGSWIRRIAADGSVTTLAGCDKVGFADRKKDAAQFYCPSSLAVDSGGNVLVADPVNSRIRKITPEGAVSTLLGGAGDRGANSDASDNSFVQPSGIAIGKQADLYVIDGGQMMLRVRKISPDGKKIQTLVVIDPTTKVSDSPPKSD